MTRNEERAFVGAFLWCIPLTTIGEIWGPRWESFRNHAKYVDDTIAVLLVVLIVWYLWHECRALHRQISDEGSLG